MMRNCLLVIAMFGLTFSSSSIAKADDAADAKAIVTKAIQAAGGEKELEKLKSHSSKIKGTIHTMGADIGFNGEILVQGFDQQKLMLEIDVMNMKINITNVYNRGKGWQKINNDTMELDKDKLEEAKESAYGSWLATLVPLTDKSFTLATSGEIKVNDKPAVGVRVSRKGNRDLTIYFDAKTYLIVKTEGRVKDESGQEVNEETFFSSHEGKIAKQPMKMVIKRDGKDYLEAEVTEITAEDKFEDKVFDKP